MIKGVIEFFRRLFLLPKRTELETGLDEEIRFHIEHQIEKNLRAGMTPKDARQQAMLRFGGVERIKEDTRDQFRSPFLENFVRDLRYAGRALRRAPGFTAVVIVTLGLSLGATTAMFSIVNGIVLRPLPYPNQERLIELVHQAPGFDLDELFASPAIYFAYRDYSRTFESVGLWDWDDSPVTVTGSGQPEAIESVEVTYEVLPILGANPILGRTFNAADDRAGSTPTAILSYGYWKRRFGESNPLGRTLIVDGVPRQIIGVLPQWFRFFDYSADIFYPRQPIRSEAAFPSFDGRGIARLKPGVTLHQANADVERMIPILTKEFGRAGTRWDQGRFGPKLRWLKDTVVGNLNDTLWLLLGTIGLLLLIACANVSNLVLVRAQVRQRELAIRTALGAGSADIARVVFAESAILGFAGGSLGVVVAYLSLPLLLKLGSSDLPQVMTVKIDPTVLLVTVGISLIATLLLAFLPLIHFARPRIQLTNAMESGRSITEGRETNWARHLLLIAQVALALLLLIGSGLMIRTFVRLRQVDPGFSDPQNVLTFQMTIPITEMSDQDEAALRSRLLRMQHAIVENFAVLPGVQAAAFSSFSDGLPLDGDGRQTGFCFQTKAKIECANTLKETQFVSPHFFEALKTPLIAGRSFNWNDVDREQKVVLISENLARAQWGSINAALGKQVADDTSGPWYEIVGVVKDVHHNGLNQPPPETVIYPAVGSDTASFILRSKRIGTTGFLDEIRRAVWSVDKDLTLANVRTLGELYQRSLARTAMTLQLLSITGTMAFVLGLLGVYGIVSFAISQRRREIGIRLALGAEHRGIRQMFVKRALVLVVIGISIGLCVATGLTRLMQSQLFGISPLDPLTHLAVALLVVAAATLASYVSAQRATLLNPVEILKA